MPFDHRSGIIGRVFRVGNRSLDQATKDAVDERGIAPHDRSRQARHPINVGWRRLDLPGGHRRVRFRVTVPDIPKVVPPRPELTNRDFMGGF
ncbi:MAG TPA: hypothetical protein VLX58_02420 [Bryobacteraceae bacterium]|nr:hypothetical protein [Bryobacteraceae bacterium]